LFVVLIIFMTSLQVVAGERELESEPPPGSTSEIDTPIQQVFPEETERQSLFPEILA
jgi:hypothetical protein